MNTRAIMSGLFVIVLIVLFSACAPTTEPVKAPVYTIAIGQESFEAEVKQYRGHVMVLFYNQKFSESTEMEKRIDRFARQFEGKAKFCKFHWNLEDDPKPYRLELLPTVVLFKDGYEVDRIRGIHPDESVRAKLDDDMELWILKNVIGLEGSQYGAKFQYKFNNTYELQVVNY